MHATKLVILDRDGIINEDRDDYVKSPDEWVPLPGALEAIARLNHAGWHTVVATNQSGIGRGLFDMATLERDPRASMNQALARQGGRIDAVFFCPHTPDDGLRLPQAAARRCSSRSASATACRCTRCRWSATRCATCRPRAAVGCPPHLVLHRQERAGSTTRRSQQCCQPGAGNARCMPTSRAFAEHLIESERRPRGAAREADSGLGRPD